MTKVTYYVLCWAVVMATLLMIMVASRHGNGGLMFVGVLVICLVFVLRQT